MTIPRRIVTVLQMNGYICGKFLPLRSRYCQDMNYSGIIIGLGTFLIIGMFHPIVLKAEYYFGKRCWWVFLLVGAGAAAASLFISDIIVSTLVGVIAFSSFWSILELFEQEKRVARGWFPCNPRRKR